MTQEERELLLKDLCGRLPYGVRILVQSYKGNFIGTLIAVTTKLSNTLGEVRVKETDESLWCDYSSFKPYLRPMSSMTEEEAKELFLIHNEDRKEWEILEVSIGDKYILFKIDDGCCSFESHTIWYEDAVGSTESFDWLNKKGFDYRGLIPMGLALPAPKGMYK